MASVLMLYSADWTNELLDYRRRAVPSHRLFGFAELEQLGYRMDLCRTPARLRGLLSSPAAWRIFQAVWTMLFQHRYSCVVSTTDAPALPVLMLKAVGLIRRPVVVISVALLDAKNASGLRHALWARCLRNADALIVYATDQAAAIPARFDPGPARVVFVPFGVDTCYFLPGDEIQGPTGEQFVLSVGTNAGKDFGTLVRAMPPGTPLLVVTDQANADIISAADSGPGGVTVDQAVPIARLRELYRAATVLVVPLHEVPFSSGQTVLLENMALGKAVIVSDVSGVRDYVEPGRTATVVPPGDVPSLRRAIDEALDLPARRGRIGCAAAESVRRQFSARHFAARLSGVIAEVSSGR